MRIFRLLIVLLSGIAQFEWCPYALAHTTSDAFITLDVEGLSLSGQYDISLQDLELLLNVDTNHDEKITWGELLAKESDVFRYLTQHLIIKNGNVHCEIQPIDLQVSDLNRGMFASVIFETSCTHVPLTSLTVEYSGMFEEDAKHRGLVSISHRDQADSYVLSGENRSFEYNLAAKSASTKITQFILEGINHIFYGIDHMLFLVALVLPAVYNIRQKKYIPKEGFRDVIFSALKVVTAFTAAHTLTLCLTSFALIDPPPSRLVESLVALTILLTSLNNLRPIVVYNFWIVGFLFGLVHGVGYASVLTDLGLSGWSLAKPLIGFNLGVELAQLVILGLFLPPAFALRFTSFYYLVFLMAGSFVTAALASVWLYEQVVGRSVLFF